MKNKTQEFIKTHWFKLCILVILFLVAISIFYYFIVFIPQKENTKIESEKQTQLKNDLSKLPPPPAGQKGLTFDELKTITPKAQETNTSISNISPQSKKDFWDWIHKSLSILTQLNNIMKSMKNIASDTNYTDTLATNESTANNLSLQMEALSTPNVPFVENLVKLENLTNRLANDISNWCFDKKQELDAKKSLNFNNLAEVSNYTSLINTSTDDLNKIIQDQNDIADNLNYITAYETKYGL